MVFDDVNASSKGNFFDSKIDTKTYNSLLLCMGKVGHYYDVVSISIVEYIDKQRNDIDTIIFSIKLFGKDDNYVKLFKQLTTKVPHDWNSSLVVLFLCEVIMKKGKALFVYLNPKKDDSVEDISGINMLYKESTSKLIFDSYSSLAQSFVNGGKTDGCVY